jgi:dipeptidyl aminopeptidase/acylaminoacyl peptidase
MPKVLTALAVILAMSGTTAGAQTPPSGTPEVVVKGARHKPPEEAAPPPLDVYTQSPRIELIALSADGSRFAFVTHKAGARLLTVYDVGDGTNQVIKLSEDPLSRLTFLDNDHIALSDVGTGLRSTCPSGLTGQQKVAGAVYSIDSRINGTAFEGSMISSGNAMGMVKPHDGITASMLLNALTPPVCTDYGVRAHEAAAIVDLRSKRSFILGDKLGGDYNHMPLGLPKPVMVDGKLHLVGPFLELRDKSVGGQVAQRVFLWSVDPDTSYGRIIDDKGGDIDRDGSYVDDWLVDDAGQPVVRALYGYFNETFSIEARKGGKWVPILKRKINTKTHDVAPFIAGRGRDGQSLLIVDATAGADKQRHFRYYELSLDGKLSEPLDEDATRDRPVFDPETGALAGFAHDGEVTTYTFFDEGLAAYYQHAVDTAPGQAVKIVDMARDPAQMIVFEQGGDDPGSWHYFDFTNGKRVDIGSQYPDVPADWVASQRSITYQASDGQMLTAQLTLPPQGEAKNRALVVLPHDGPLGHDGRGFDWLAQALASRGYVVLQPNYRGSDGGDAALTEAGYGQWSGKSLSDLSDGVAYLAGQGIVDANRVCIAGQGYGGYAALSSAKKGSPYRCAVAINGIADPAGYLGTARGNAIADDIAALKADPQQPRAFIADSASPSVARRYFGDQTPAAIAAASISVPVLLVTSQYDKIVPTGPSKGLRDGLIRAGKPVTYVELPGNSHAVSTGAARLATAQAVVDFLKVNNPAN